MDLKPGPQMLAQMRAQNLSWKLVLGELIDNAFDANASRVAVTFGKKREVVVEDNGNGCDDIEAMLTIGKHCRQPTTKLGRYGVGLKDAACWLWGQTMIATIKKAIKRTTSIDWQKLAAQADWELPDPVDAPPLAGEVGTKLTFRNITRTISDYESLVNDISYTFTPGLRQGKQISFQFPRKQPMLAKVYSMPPLDDIIEDTLRVGDRTARIHVGIVKEGHDNLHPGFAICHHHRVITTTSVGSGGHSTARIAGEVWLDGSWSLSKNKDDINDHLEELGQAIFNRCKPILLKAETQAMNITSAAFTSKLTDMFRSALLSVGNGRKEKRAKKENETGAVEPVGTAKKRKRASKTQPGGNLMDPQKVGALRIDWAAFEGDTLGSVDQAGNVIWLNQRNDHLADLRKRENLEALLAICTGMYVHEAFTSQEPQKYLKGLRPETYEGKFVGMWAAVLGVIGRPQQNVRLVS